MARADEVFRIAPCAWMMSFQYTTPKAGGRKAAARFGRAYSASRTWG